MAVISPVTFVTDPMASVAVASGLAATALIPEAWIEIVLYKVYKRWLTAIDEVLSSEPTSIPDRVRRLFNEGIKVDYTIIVPANNREKRTGMGALEALVNTPLTNITKTVRSRVLAAIGTEAGLTVTAVLQPTLGIMEHEVTTTTFYNETTTRMIATAGAPARLSLHMVVTCVLMLFCWTVASAESAVR